LNVVRANEASEDDKHGNGRIIDWPPFMNKVYGTCKFSVTNNNNLLFLLTFSKKNSFCFCCHFRTKCDCKTTAQMNQLWKREKNLWWCFCTQQSFNLSGGGTVRRMTVGGFILFIFSNIQLVVYHQYRILIG